MSFVAYTNTKQYQDGIQRAAEIIQSADNFFVLGLRHCAEFSKYIARTFSHIAMGLWIIFILHRIFLKEKLQLS